MRGVEGERDGDEEVERMKKRGDEDDEERG